MSPRTADARICVVGKALETKEGPGWNMMGDKFQLGPFKDVIVGARQRVTQGTNFFEKVFRVRLNPGRTRSRTAHLLSPTHVQRRTRSRPTHLLPPTHVQRRTRSRPTHL